MPRGPRSLKINDNLRKLIREYKGDHKDDMVCKNLDISQKTLARIMSGRELRLSERILSRIAVALDTSLESLTIDQAESSADTLEVTSYLDENNSIGRAMLASARGDHRQALDLLGDPIEAVQDPLAFVGYRLAAARAYSGLKELEKAERLLREAITYLDRDDDNPLLQSRCAFELGILLSRRQKTFDAIEAFGMAERILEKQGNPLNPHLFLIRQYFLGITLRIGDINQSIRLLNRNIEVARSIQQEEGEGLSILDEQLLAALKSQSESGSG